ncbi:AC3_0185 family rSAM-modified Cys-rich RiPP [Ruminiclostridium cellobioparum]|uniref:Modification target Cys-rich peptide, AC3_0185 family n=1 Tax=Ruminiclostridium cellobioparum subsp. termitidis CT1112 TaxID=1195236 RepID=S0FK83_RUMCE|nr:AC3_0185 family rSAM-modified Cys-rich RiPP [Ruminiclostridium cellobioparum]EMS69579.1 modification target Cys-rich peptide, AC3_0185 family [Ruminiclostridium cellobioparum subsp. termitidis CT1112]
MDRLFSNKKINKSRQDIKGYNGPGCMTCQHECGNNCVGGCTGTCEGNCNGCAGSCSGMCNSATAQYCGSANAW